MAVGTTTLMVNFEDNVDHRPAKEVQAELLHVRPAMADVTVHGSARGERQDELVGLLASPAAIPIALRVLGAAERAESAALKRRFHPEILVGDGAHVRPGEPVGTGPLGKR
jgi:hypothetical protein